MDNSSNNNTSSNQQSANSYPQQQPVADYFASNNSNNPSPAGFESSTGAGEMMSDTETSGQTFDFDPRNLQNSPSPPQQPQPQLQPQPQQQQQTQPHRVHRPSFTPPFPVPVTSSNSTTPTTPLTNHEIYELIHNRSQQRKASVSPFKQIKRASLYVQRSHNALERQSSMIVGTPGFKERYGEYQIGYTFSGERAMLFFMLATELNGFDKPPCVVFVLADRWTQSAQSFGMQPKHKVGRRFINRVCELSQPCKVCETCA